jgi:hypothetical protein
VAIPKRAPSLDESKHTSAIQNQAPANERLPSRVCECGRGDRSVVSLDCAGDRVNSHRMNILGWITTVAIFAASVGADRFVVLVGLTDVATRLSGQKNNFRALKRPAKFNRRYASKTRSDEADSNVGLGRDVREVGLRAMCGRWVCGRCAGALV